MKKIILTILAILICLSMLVSCAKEIIINQTEESAKVTESESLKEETEKQTEKQTNILV